MLDAPTAVADHHEPTLRRPETPGRSIRTLAPALVAALLAFLTYAVTLGGTFIYDDVPILQHDVRAGHPARWADYWVHEYFSDGPDHLYRPLTSMSLAVQYWLHDGRPFALHLANVLLHAGVSAMVALLGWRLGGARVAWIAGVLYAVHPVHSEVVAGLVGRSELLCTLAMVGGLYLFLNGSLTRPRVGAIVACFVVALLAKEQGILFPLLILAAVPLRRWAAEDRRASKWLVVAFCWIPAMYIVWRELAQSIWRRSGIGMYWSRDFIEPLNNPLVLSTGVDRILMPIALLGRYVSLLVAPVRLSIDYGADVIGHHARASDPYLYLGAVTLLAWGILTTVALRRRRWALALCLIALPITYCLVANAGMLIGTIFGERLMYLPSVFFLLIVAMGMSRLRRRALIVPIVVVLTLAGAMRTFAYVRQWNDPLAFYLQQSRTQPRSLKGYVLAYGEYTARGDWRAALRVGERCGAALPGYPYAHLMCIEPLLKLGDPPAADAAAARAQQACPGEPMLSMWRQRTLDAVAKVASHKP